MSKHLRFCLAFCPEMMNENAIWIWEEEVLHIWRDGSQPNTAQSREERVSVKGRGSSWWQTGSWRHLSLACREQLPQISFVRWWVSGSSKCNIYYQLYGTSQTRFRWVGVGLKLGQHQIINKWWLEGFIVKLSLCLWLKTLLFVPDIWLISSSPFPPWGNSFWGD